MAEIIRFKEEFELIRNDSSIKTDLSSFWLRKTKKPVLAVLLVQKPGGRPKLYRGTNMEVSMPTGSLCAERNVIGSALADDLTLKREDLKVIAVYSVRTLEDILNEKEKTKYHVSESLPLNVDGTDGGAGSGSQTVDSSPYSSRNISRSNSYTQHEDIKYHNTTLRSDHNDLNGTSEARCKRQKGNITDTNTLNNSDYSVYQSDKNKNPSDISSVALRSCSNSLCQEENMYSSFFTAQTQTANSIDHSPDLSMAFSLSATGRAATTTAATTTAAAATAAAATAGAADGSLAYIRDELLSSSTLHDLPAFRLPPRAVFSTAAPKGSYLVPADARRSITAGKRSYSVGSIWISKSPVGRDIEGSIPALGATGSLYQTQSGPSSASNLLTAELFENNGGERKEISSQVTNMNPALSRSPLGKKRAIMDIPITWPHRTGSGIVESVKSPIDMTMTMSMSINETKIENQKNHHRNNGTYALAISTRFQF